MAASKERRRRKKTRFGYSLIELVVSIFVVGLLMSSIALALVYCNQYMRTSQTKAEAQEQALNAAVWLSRYLQDGNITAMYAQTSSGTTAPGISFESVRDPKTAQVDWSSNTTGGTVEWPQNVVVYLQNDLVIPNQQDLWSKSIPNPQPGGQYPLDPPTPLILSAGTTFTGAGVTTRVLAQNIRTLMVEIYSTAQPEDTPPFSNNNNTNTVNITIEAYAPYYGLNYGVNVSTAIRPQN
jgi:type II secretory pathway pseudopilin PulG